MVQQSVTTVDHGHLPMVDDSIRCMTMVVHENMVHVDHGHDFTLDGARIHVHECESTLAEAEFNNIRTGQREGGPDEIDHGRPWSTVNYHG